MKFLSVIGSLAIIVLVAVGVYFFGGLYNVAATQTGAAVVAWALGQIRQASIFRHAPTDASASLQDDAIIQSGARAFAMRGCTNCHGGPGVEGAKFSEGLRPHPPDLKDVAGKLTAQQIFWVIKNGINMTGMPAFEKIAADDNEIWAITAFVRRLPMVSETDYKAWASAPDAQPPAK